MYLIDISKLNKGDIILTRDKKGLLSALIRLFTRGKYSHASLYLDSSTLIHATREGIHTLTLRTELFSSLSDFMVLRTREVLTPQQWGTIELFVRTIGYSRQYDIRGAIASGIPNNQLSEHGKKYFCSSFIAEAYKNAGIQLVNHKDTKRVTPKDLRNSSSLNEIKNCYFEISGEELQQYQEMLANSIDVSKIQEQAVNNILEDMKKEYSRYGVEIPSFPKGLDIYSYVQKGDISLDNARKIDIKIESSLKRNKYDNFANIVASNPGSNYNKTKEELSHLLEQDEALYNLLKETYLKPLISLQICKDKYQSLISIEPFKTYQYMINFCEKDIQLYQNMLTRLESAKVLSQKI